jgi:predicted RNA binding protein YcfA (HicA-like mRNA interferase family)
MSRLPALKSQEVIRALEDAGFRIVRQRGSHVRMKHPDGRVVTVPVHIGQDIGHGLLRKIFAMRN